MKRLSVVFTEHEESGRTNSSELLTILARIKPEVLFWECPPEAIETYFNGPRRNLESTAVIRYRENHHVDVIPVDLPTPEGTFFKNFDDLIERVARKGPDYDRIASWHRQYVYQYGFAYLNSDYCSDLLAARHEVILNAIGKLGDRRLDEHYDLWIKTNERRDQAMMNNIQNHIQQTPCIRAAFLIGAAHRRSIVALSGSASEAASSTIQWDFSSFLGEPSVPAAQ